MADGHKIIGIFDRPFDRQIDFFKKKLNLPSERYDDITRAAHDRGFIVAGVEKADLLNDLSHAVEKTIAGGGSVDDFRKDFWDIVDRHGWHGWTGEGTAGGEAWRTRVIFETNLRVSQAAGRYKQLTDPGLLKRRPYWQYVHSGHHNPRPLHKQWGDERLTLRHDHPFWETHYPPNGYHCGCTVRAVPDPEDGAATEPPGGWDTPDPRTGQMPGIDKGFDYAPGAQSDMPLRQFVQDKLITYPPAIQRALMKDTGRYLNAIDRIEDFVRKVRADHSLKDPLWIGFVEAPERFEEIVKETLMHFLVMIPPDVIHHTDAHHGNDGKGQRPPKAADYARLMRGLETGELQPSRLSKMNKLQTFVVRWKEGDEEFRAVYEVRPGHRNRTIALFEFLIKTGKGR